MTKQDQFGTILKKQIMNTIFTSNFVRIVTLLVLTILSYSAIAQDASNEKIEALLTTMEAEKQFINSLEAMLELQKNSNQTAMLPEGFFEAFLQQAKDEFKTELLPKLSAIYKANLSGEEVDQLIAFYNTDLGKLMLTKMPTIQTESANAGMVWGQQLGMEVAQKLMTKE